MNLDIIKLQKKSLYLLGRVLICLWSLVECRVMPQFAFLLDPALGTSWNLLELRVGCLALC